MDEVQKLILQVQGKQQVEELRAAIVAQEATLRELNQLTAQNTPLTKAQADQQQRTAEAMLANKAALDQLAEAERQAAEATQAAAAAAKAAAAAAKAEELENRLLNDVIKANGSMTAVQAAEKKHLASTITQLKAEIKAEERTVRELNEVQQQNGSLTAAQEAQQKRAAAGVVQHTAELKNLQSGFRGLGSGGMQLSYVMQDLVAQNGDLLRGFMAIQNNMPGLIMSFGGSMGLASVISMVSLAISLALPVVIKWLDSLSPKALDPFLDALGVLNEQLETLKHKEIKLGTDPSDIENLQTMISKLQEGLAGFKQWEHEHTDWEQKAGKQVSNILSADDNAKATRQTLIDKEVAGLRTTEPALAEALGRQEKVQAAVNQHAQAMRDVVKNGGVITGANKEYGDWLQSELRKETDIINTHLKSAKDKAKATIGLLYTKAKEGDEEAREDLTERLKAAGLHRLAGDIGSVSPARIKAQADRQAEIEAQNEEGQVNEEFQKEQETMRLLTEKYGKTALDKFRSLPKDQAIKYTHGTTSESQGFERFGQEVAAIDKLVLQYGKSLYDKYEAMTPQQHAALAQVGDTPVATMERWLRKQKASADLLREHGPEATKRYEALTPQERQGLIHDGESEEQARGRIIHEFAEEAKLTRKHGKPAVAEAQQAVAASGEYVAPGLPTLQAVGQHATEHEQADARQANLRVNELARQQQQARLALPALGINTVDQMMNAQQQLNQQPPGADRDRAQAALDDRIRNAAYQQLRATMPPIQAREAAEQMPSAIRDNLREGQEAVRVFGGNPNAPIGPQVRQFQAVHEMGQQVDQAQAQAMQTLQMSPAAMAAVARVNGFMQGVQAAQQTYDRYFEQIGQGMGQNAYNQRFMQEGMRGGGIIPGPNGGNSPY